MRRAWQIKILVANPSTANSILYIAGFIDALLLSYYDEPLAQYDMHYNHQGCYLYVSVYIYVKAREYVQIRQNLQKVLDANCNFVDLPTIIFENEMGDDSNDYL